MTMHYLVIEHFVHPVLTSPEAAAAVGHRAVNAG
jgi:hypothetical protein